VAAAQATVVPEGLVVRAAAAAALEVRLLERERLAVEGAPEARPLARLQVWTSPTEAAAPEAAGVAAVVEEKEAMVQVHLVFLAEPEVLGVTVAPVAGSTQSAISECQEPARLKEVTVALVVVAVQEAMDLNESSRPTETPRTNAPGHAVDLHLRRDEGVQLPLSLLLHGRQAL
jgi:hypothetical protein